MKSPLTRKTERLGIALATEAFETIDFAFRVQSESDFGIDAHAELIAEGQASGQLLGLQIKAGTNYFKESDDLHFIYRTDERHAEYWIEHSLPVVICLCNLSSRQVHWQTVNRTNMIRTGRGLKFLVPRSQRVDLHSAGQLRDLVTPIVPENRYTVFQLSDVSLGIAKRYSIDVVLNGTLSKSEISNVVKQSVKDAKQRRYHRNTLSEERWSKSTAHVVWVFVYPTAQDCAIRNHICRGLWVDEALPAEFRPARLSGENIGDNLIVDWNTHYHASARRAAESTLVKEAYLAAALPIKDEIVSAVDLIDRPLSSLTADSISEADFIRATGPMLNRLGELYRATNGIGLPPYECQALDEALRSIVASLDNVRLYFSAEGRTTWPPATRSRMAARDWERTRGELQTLIYEASKVLR